MAFKQNCSRIYLMTTLIIARHGNTFGPDVTPTRIGARTDLPLVESGQTQGEKLGAWLKENEVYPEVVYSSELQRTKQTAEIARTIRNTVCCTFRRSQSTVVAVRCTCI